MESKNMVTQTVVWWDINSCVVPVCYNASEVGLRIEQALIESGYYPATITAIGNLNYTLIQRPDVLRDLSSCGVRLKHVLEGFDLDCLSIILEDMLAWRWENPPPASIMLISGGVEDLALTFHRLGGPGYTLLRSYPERPTSQTYPRKEHSRVWHWESLLNSRHKKVSFPSERCKSGWVCALCEPYSEICFSGHRFEEFTTHLKSRDHAPSELGRQENKRIKYPDSGSNKKEDRMSIDTMPLPKEDDAKVTVWWDINSCPVPCGYDPRRVRPSIESALKKLGYSFPPTITAVGNLRIPLRENPDVLPAIYSTGILLKHILGNPGFINIRSKLVTWRMENPPPATLMLISSGSVENIFGPEYTILRAVPLQASSLPTSKHHWVWESLLKESRVLQENHSESLWDCTICYRRKGSSGQTFEEFTTHLKSRDHALCELDTVARPLSRKMVDLLDLEPSEKRSGEGEGEGEGEEEEEEEEEEDKDYEWERSSLDGILFTMSHPKDEEDEWDRQSIYIE